jgi:hypothetical protein
MMQSGGLRMQAHEREIETISMSMNMRMRMRRVGLLQRS